ncbi:MAG TPA: TonB-dependent receptor, partial [Sphingomonas sp.]
MRKTMWLAAASVLVPDGAVAQTAGVAAPTPQQTTPTGTDAGAAEDEAGEGGDIIVTGSRTLPGSVVGDIPPEVQLGPADIRSYGVNSVAELLTELAPQTGSGRGGGGQPVVLLNGRRISGFSEIRDLPTEAIARVDILPEEVALKYGYRADQRVVNFVLRRRFRAVTAEATGRVATEGGREDGQGELDLLTIARDQRINLHLSYREQGALTEAERDVIAVPSNASIAGNVLGSGTVIAGVPAGAAGGPLGLGAFLGTGQTATDPTPFRTLQSASQAFSANATYARPIGNVAATLNARVETTNREGLNGLPIVALALPQGNPFSPFPSAVTVARAIDTGSPLTQRSSSVTAHLGTTFNGQLGTWNWSLTGAYDRVASKTFTETGVDATAFQDQLNANDPSANPFGALTPALIGPAVGNRALSTSTIGQVDALLFGRLFALPAGDVSTSVRLGA